MATAVYAGLTGSGFQGFSGSGSNLIVRINVTATGVAQPLFPFGTPQRYGGIGWVSAFDQVPAGFDGVFPTDMSCIVNPVTWIDTLQLDLDLTPLNTDLFGVSGLAYALNSGVSIDVYVTEF